MVVTAVALIYQCALMARTARGRRTLRPKSRQAVVKRLRSSAFIGLPCPMNAAGMASSTRLLTPSSMESDGSNGRQPMVEAVTITYDDELRERIRAHLAGHDR